MLKKLIERRKKKKAEEDLRRERIRKQIFKYRLKNGNPPPQRRTRPPFRMMTGPN